MTIDEFIDDLKALEKRITEDEFVSDDIKTLAVSVRVIAEGLKDTQEFAAELANRPTKNITVNYGK